jgi:uncharacterized membrane protein YoaK (UPF0700 family)
MTSPLAGPRAGAGEHDWSRRTSEAAWIPLVVLLAFAAGSVDALSYLGLGNIFTANQSGNIVLLGLGLGQGHSLATLRSLVSLLGFLVGVGLAVLIGVPLTRQMRWSAAITWVLAFESVILLSLTLWGALARPNAETTAILPFIVLAATAMGMQSITLWALGVPGVTSTVIASTLTLLMGISGAELRRPLDMSAPAAQESSPARPAPLAPPSRAGLLALVVGVYLLAAIVTGVAERTFLLAAAAIPTATVALVVVAALLASGSPQ